MADSNKSSFLRSLSFKSKKNVSDKAVRRSASQKHSRHSDGRLSVSSSPLICEAIRPFQGILPCDLSFSVGDKITILTRTEKQFDWWEGKLKGKIGIFPANYVRVLTASEGF